MKIETDRHVVHVVVFTVIAAIIVTVWHLKRKPTNRTQEIEQFGDSLHVIQGTDTLRFILKGGNND